MAKKSCVLLGVDKTSSEGRESSGRFIFIKEKTKINANNAKIITNVRFPMLFFSVVFF